MGENVIDQSHGGTVRPLAQGRYPGGVYLPVVFKRESWMYRPNLQKH